MTPYYNNKRQKSWISNAVGRVNAVSKAPKQLICGNTSRILHPRFSTCHAEKKKINLSIWLMSYNSMWLERCVQGLNPSDWNGHWTNARGWGYNRGMAIIFYPHILCRANWDGSWQGQIMRKHPPVGALCFPVQIWYFICRKQQIWLKRKTYIFVLAVIWHQLCLGGLLCL